MPTVGSLSSRARSAWLAIRLKDQHEEERPRGQRGQQRHQQRAAVAERVEQFLARDREDARQRRCRGSARTSRGQPFAGAEQRHERVLERRRSRSARSVRPRCLRRRRGRRRGSRCGRTAPRLPASRATRTAGTCLRRATARNCSRSARTLMMSRPLVGSSSRIVDGSWTSARAIATFIFSPCEKPCVRRSASAVRPSVSISASMRASSAAPDSPCSAP